MAQFTKEQLDQKLQELKQLTEEVETLTQELAEAGALELPEEYLDKATGGKKVEAEDIAAIMRKIREQLKQKGK